MGKTVWSTMCVCGDNRQLADPGSDNFFTPHTDRGGNPCPGVPHPGDSGRDPGAPGERLLRRIAVVRRTDTTSDGEVSLLRADVEAADCHVIVLPASVEWVSWDT